MSMLRITCPHCSFSRDVPADKLPDQPVQANCPKCKQSFSFSKADATEAPTVAAPPPPQVPPPIAPAAEFADPQPAPPVAAKAEPGNKAGKPVSRELMSVGELFSVTWELYKQRWLLLIGIFIATGIAAAALPVLVTFGMSGIAKGSFGGMVTMFMLLGLAVIASMAVLCWGMAAALTAAVDESLGFKDSFEYAKGVWLSLAWVSTLYSFIVGGAALLFLIPGILTGIWFFACGYLVVAEKTRGMDALLKSKALVDGRFWPVLGRLVLVWLVGMVLGVIPLIGPVCSLLVAPFSMLYSVTLYRNLSETAGTVSWSSTDGTKAAWLLLGLAGYILVPLLIFLLLGAAFFASFEPLFRMMLQHDRLQHVLSVGRSLVELAF